MQRWKKDVHTVAWYNSSYPGSKYRIESKDVWLVDKVMTMINFYEIFQNSEYR